MATAIDDKSRQTRDILRNLYELIEALDKRVPHLERMGEAQIAHDASDLRERAISLIKSIEGAKPKD